MSNVLTDLMREKQDWIERNKYKSSLFSSIINIFITITIGFVVVKLIENPDFLWNLVKLFF